MKSGWRRRLLGVLIVINTALFGFHLIVQGDLRQAGVALMTCIVCWLGLYVVAVTEKRSSKELDEDKSEADEIINERDSENDGQGDDS